MAETDAQVLEDRAVLMALRWGPASADTLREAAAPRSAQAIRGAIGRLTSSGLVEQAGDDAVLTSDGWGEVNRMLTEQATQHVPEQGEAPEGDDDGDDA